MSDLATALQIAIKVHAGQVDKQGQPYLLHILRVVDAVSDEAKVVAALHDVIEDSSITAAGLNAKGIGTKYTDSIVDLTRGEESYADYIERIATSGGITAVEVKIADLRDNLGRMPEIPNPGEGERGWTRPTKPEWASLRRRYERALATLEGSQLQAAPDSAKDLELGQNDSVISSSSGADSISGEGGRT
jgi:(p)ppGpp synthase/HD superfamily hydrolase